MQECIQGSINTILLTYSLVEGCLIHSKTVQLFACLSAAIIPRPLIHFCSIVRMPLCINHPTSTDSFFECKLVCTAQERSSLSDVCNFGSCTKAICISTNNNIPPVVFMTANRLYQYNAAIQCILWSLSCNSCRTPVVIAPRPKQIVRLRAFWPV